MYPAPVCVLLYVVNKHPVYPAPVCVLLYVVNEHPVYPAPVCITRGTDIFVRTKFYPFLIIYKRPFCDHMESCRHGCNAEWLHLHSLTVYCFLLQRQNCDGRQSDRNTLTINDMWQNILYRCWFCCIGLCSIWATPSCCVNQSLTIQSTQP